MGIAMNIDHPKTHLGTTVYQQDDGTWQTPSGEIIREEDLYGRKPTTNEIIIYSLVSLACFILAVICLVFGVINNYVK